MMGYWKNMYGERNKDFIDGIIAAMWTYAIWKDGKQVIGVLEQPLNEVIEEVKRELNYPKEVS